MAIYVCQVCEYRYDEEREGAQWSELGDDWTCPVCGSPKRLYNPLEEISSSKSDGGESKGVSYKGEVVEYDDLLRESDERESYMQDIHQIASEGVTLIEPMRTARPVYSWDSILIKGAQLARIPLNDTDPVSTKTTIGPKAKKPLVVESPIVITHMSFGALSKEAKISLAMGSAAAKTAMCSGEGGILPEEMEYAYRYIFEYVPNRYSVTPEHLRKVDAVEIKIGQSAKPGMGGHLPGHKVTAEIASLRGFKEGDEIISPAHHPDITSGVELKEKVDWLRDQSEGKPIGIKIAAGNIEDDIDVALSAAPDFITVDGRAGATGAAPKFVKTTSSLPSIFALYRARKVLDSRNASDVSLVVTGGYRISPDIAKALAMGADAVAIGTAALMAIGCQQYRVCHTGRCPMGITSQDPELRARMNVEQSAKGLENFLNVSTEELRTFARLTGKNDVHSLAIGDLCTTDSEISGHTDIAHV